MRRTLPIAAVLLGGCGGGGGPPADGYDPQLTYPPRADVLVVAPPKAPPTALHESGKLDAHLRMLGVRGGAVLDPAAAPADARAALDATLREVFGSPAAPTVSIDGADALGLTAEALARGGRVYKDKCFQCHGLGGDGRGLTAQMVYPPPRDYRRGQFKFASAPNGRPTRADLARVIKAGIDGNSMPPFTLLPDDQVADLAAHTIHLSVRGEAEFDTLAAILGEDGLPAAEVPAFARKRAAKAVAAWAEAEAKAVNPPVQPTDPKEAGADAAHDARVRRGAAVFATGGACLSCHRDYGRETHYLYDVWGVAVRPPDLTTGRYKGGGDPVELFRRVRCGIQPAGMPAAALTDDQAWDVVAFVRALPVPRHLPPDVRATVYPQAR